ncbi:hypothetical protein COEREDRAFT_22623, partial [Coemansia reversa NRRL 1564]
TILLIGEGNFSFARSIASRLESGTNIVATALDSEAVVKEKYSADAEDHIKEFRRLGGTVMFGIDGTKLKTYKQLRGKRFSHIVFNFPHTGSGDKDEGRNIILNQRLLLEFFNNVRELLTDGIAISDRPTKRGQVHVTLKSGKPYDMWKITKLARQCGLITLSAYPFKLTAYPGYEHRRTLGFKEGLSTDDNQEIRNKNPKVYVF